MNKFVSKDTVFMHRISLKRGSPDLDLLWKHNKTGNVCVILEAVEVFSFSFKDDSLRVALSDLRCNSSIPPQESGANSISDLTCVLYNIRAWPTSSFTLCSRDNLLEVFIARVLAWPLNGNSLSRVTPRMCKGFLPFISSLLRYGLGALGDWMYVHPYLLLATIVLR